jgi:basic membrane lipoprotein Med (substrate-binding protein (PBP1-ABC) superfamily)
MRVFKKLLFGVAALAAALGAPTAATAGSTKSVIVHNKTNMAISGVRFSETWSDSYGGDTLGANYINPGVEYRVFVTSESCLIDMKVIFTNRVAHEIRFNICTYDHVDDVGDRLVVAG